MGTWINRTLDGARPVDDWLAGKRNQSLKQLKATPWPTRKTEAWKYTPVTAIEKSRFATSTQRTIADSADIPGLDSLDVVMVDGQLHAVPSELPTGLTITPLSQAGPEQRQWGLELFAAAKPEHHYFGLVNDVLATTGVMIDVEPATRIEQPIRLVHLSSNGTESHGRHLVRLGKDAQATVIEQSTGNSASLNTLVVEYALAEQAALEHYRLALETGEALSVSGSHFNLGSHSRLVSTLIGYGSRLSRVNIDVNHRGQHAEAALNGIYLLDRLEHFDLHSCIEHEVPNGTTKENIRGIVAGRAHAVFNGRIHIHRGAQKTLAELNNRNLLLSREAEIDTKPELEIYADDVRCTHGATIAEIDQAALYYLCSRGIDRKQALLMLNFGFVNELLDQVPNECLSAWLRQNLKSRFMRMHAHD